MMLPNQITSQNFSQNGKGGYKADEVKAFLQRVYQSYSRLYAENKTLADRLDEVLPKLEEYERSKTTIADALIWAKATAEKNIEEANGIAERTVADATEKAERLLEDTKAQADAYYADKTVTAEKNVEKARAEFESLKQQSELYSERYIAEINVKAQTIIEDANTKAGAIVAAAYADAKKAREKAEIIIAEANAELKRLEGEAAKIKSEILSLITYAQSAAEQIDVSAFGAVELPVSTVVEDVQPKTVEPDEVESFTFEGIQGVSVADVEQSPEEESPPTPQPSTGVQPGYVRFFGADIPDVNDIISGIFSAASDSAAQSSGEEEPGFRFERVASDFDRPFYEIPDESDDEDTDEEPEPFSFLRKDSE